MDPNLYKAAMEGNVPDALIKRYGDESTDQFADQVTPNKNTVLVVAVQFGNDPFVKQILSKCPSLVSRVNDNGDTPLHTACSEEWWNSMVTVESLIGFAKEGSSGAAEVGEMLRARNHDGDTPLHAAARNNRLQNFLSCVLKEGNPGLDHGPNKAGETPLYLYVERGSYDEKELSQLLETCTPSEYGGPKGRTALHAAIIHRKDDFLKKLIEWKKDLIKERDSYGRTALHYAAENGDVATVKMLIDKDESVACVTAIDYEGNTALHMATAKGNTKVMKTLLTNCPDCWEMVNSKGQNIFHVSVNLERHKSTKYISNQPWVRFLFNRKDHEGNTPMDMLAQKGNLNSFFVMGTLERVVTGKRWIQQAVESFSKIGRNPCSVPEVLLRRAREISQGGEEQKEKQKGKEKGKYEIQMVPATLNHEKEKEKEKATEGMDKMAETNMIVATLISTISFAAGFTIPGGYHGDQDPNQGMAILAREAAFKAFVITNTIALVCSTSSVFLYVSAKLFSRHEGERRADRYVIAFWLILVAMMAMMVAFGTGTYAVLAHYLGLGITACAIACLAFVVYIIELKTHFGRGLGALPYYGGQIVCLCLVGFMILLLIAPLAVASGGVLLLLSPCLLWLKRGEVGHILVSSFTN